MIKIQKKPFPVQFKQAFSTSNKILVTNMLLTNVYKITNIIFSVIHGFKKSICQNWQDLRITTHFGAAVTVDLFQIFHIIVSLLRNYFCCTYFIFGAIWTLFCCHTSSVSSGIGIFFNFHCFCYRTILYSTVLKSRVYRCTFILCLTGYYKAE